MEGIVFTLELHLGYQRSLPTSSALFNRRHCSEYCILKVQNYYGSLQYVFHMILFKILPVALWPRDLLISASMWM